MKIQRILAVLLLSGSSVLMTPQAARAGTFFSIQLDFGSPAYSFYPYQYDLWPVYGYHHFQSPYYFSHLHFHFPLISYYHPVYYSRYAPYSFHYSYYPRHFYSHLYYSYYRQRPYVHYRHKPAYYTHKKHLNHKYRNDHDRHYDRKHYGNRDNRRPDYDRKRHYTDRDFHRPERHNRDQYADKRHDFNRDGRRHGVYGNRDDRYSQSRDRQQFSAQSRHNADPATIAGRLNEKRRQDYKPQKSFNANHQANNRPVIDRQRIQPDRQQRRTANNPRTATQANRTPQVRPAPATLQLKNPVAGHSARQNPGRHQERLQERPVTRNRQLNGASAQQRRMQGEQHNNAKRAPARSGRLDNRQPQRQQQARPQFQSRQRSALPSAAFSREKPQLRQPASARSSQGRPQIRQKKFKRESFGNRSSGQRGLGNIGRMRLQR